MLPAVCLAGGCAGSFSYEAYVVIPVHDLLPDVERFFSGFSEGKKVGGSIVQADVSPLTRGCCAGIREDMEVLVGVVAFCLLLAPEECQQCQSD